MIVPQTADETTAATEGFDPAEIVCMLGHTALIRLTEQYRGYRDLLQLAKERDQQRTKPRSLEELGMQLPSERRRAIEREVRNLPEDLSGLLEQRLEKVRDRSVEGKRHPYSYEQIVVGALYEIGKTSLRELFAAFITACQGDQHAFAYGMAYLRWQRHRHADHLAHAIVPMAITSFETFLAEMLRTWYLAHSETIDGSKKQTSFGAVVQYATIDDVRRAAIDMRVADVLAQAPASWRSELRKDGLELTLRPAGGPWHDVLEVFARRNVIIHNDDRVDETYQQRTPWIRSGPEVGLPLQTDAVYALKAMELLESTAGGLTVGVLVDLVPSSRDLVSVVVELTYEGLRAHRWTDVVAVASTFLDVQSTDEVGPEIRINRWMARTKLGEDVLEEVNAWVVPSDNPRLSLGVAALLGNIDATLEALERLEASGEHMRPIAEWPLLADLGQRSPRIRTSLQRYRRTGSQPRPRRRTKRA